jgi:hypothetical protein
MSWMNKYEEVSGFNEGRAWVCNNGKYGFVDLDGNEVTKLKYDDATSFRYGRAYIRVMNIVGEIDLNGREYFKPVHLAKLRKLRMSGIIESL